MMGPLLLLRNSPSFKARSLSTNPGNRFARLKKKYMLKKKEGTNNWQDDVNFMKADTAENTRLKRIGKERMQADSRYDSAFPSPPFR